MQSISNQFILAILVLGQIATPQEVTTELQILADPVLSLNHTYVVTSESEPATEASIRLGDALGLRMVLRNASNEPSEEVDATLAARSRPPTIVVHPDGKETIVPIFSSAFTVPPRARSLKPGEEVTIDIFVYKVITYDDYGRQIGFDYVFPKPGTYQLYFRHQPEDARTAIEKKRAGEQLRPPLVSNRVTVHVGEPFPGWEELREAGIIHAVGSGDWPQAFESPQRQREVEQLVAKADRPWLTRWFEDVKKHRRMREEERTQEENEQRDPPLSLRGPFDSVDFNAGSLDRIRSRIVP